jgi:Protein of unknown function (DUF1566)
MNLRGIGVCVRAVPLAWGVTSMLACSALLGVDFEGRPRTSASALPDAAVADSSWPDGIASLDSGDDKAGDYETGDRAWSMWPVDDQSPLQTVVQGRFVIDQISGLSWPIDAIAEPLSWAQAQTACSELDYGGFADFRMPTRIELLSIVNYTGIALHSLPLLEPPQTRMWTRSGFVLDRNKAWAVDFVYGTAGDEPKEILHGVRCVRGGRSIPNRPADRFVVDTGTVFDRVTQLTWQQQAIPGPFDPAGARDFCRKLTVLGTGGFRVPALHELYTLVDDSTAKPALAQPAFVAGAAPAVWASTNDGKVGFAYILDFGAGHSMHIGTTTQTFGVRCVR